MPRILSRIEPLRLCSPRGYLCRVAFAFRYDSPMRLLKLAGLRGLRDLDSEDSIPRVSYALRLDPDEWKALPYLRVKVRNGFEKRLFCGQIVDAGRINNGAPRVCPSCLIENQIWWALWDLNLVCACPRHYSLLIDTCSSCERRLRWTRPAPHLCKCGYDLRRSRSPRASDDLVDFTAFIYHTAGMNARDSIYSASVAKKSTAPSVELNTLLQCADAAVLLDRSPSTSVPNVTDDLQHVRERCRTAARFLSGRSDAFYEGLLPLHLGNEGLLDCSPYGAFRRTHSYCLRTQQ